jgi:hypothetical protein
MNAKYLILPLFLSSLSIAQETNPSANKKAVLASVEKTPTGTNQATIKYGIR